MVVHSIRHVHSNYLQLGFPSILNITHQHTPKQSSTISRLPKHPAIFSDNDWGVKSPQHNIQVLSPFSEGDCIPRVFRTILHQKLYSNPHFPRKNGWKLNCKGLNRGFPKMVVPPKHPKMILFRRKTLVVGETHHFRKPPKWRVGPQLLAAFLLNPLKNFGLPGRSNSAPPILQSKVPAQHP